MYKPVPVFFALVKCRKDEWYKDISILADKINDPIIVPEVQSPLCHLKRNYIYLKQKVTIGESSSKQRLNRVYIEISRKQSLRT